MVRLWTTRITDGGEQVTARLGERITALERAEAEARRQAEREARRKAIDGALGPALEAYDDLQRALQGLLEDRRPYVGAHHVTPSTAPCGVQCAVALDTLDCRSP